MVQCLFCKYLGNQVSDFQSVFFSWKLRSICKFWIQNHFCAILGGQDGYETNVVLKQINSYLYCLILALKLQNLCQALQTGPRQALIAPKSLLLGLVTQTDWMDVITVIVLIIFKISGSSRLNNLVLIRIMLSRIAFCFANISAPKNRTKMVLYSKCAYGSQFLGEENNLRIRSLVAEILSKNPVSFFLGHPVYQTVLL